MNRSNKYESIIMGNDEGFLATEKGKQKHKPEEKECGEIMSENGMQVILKDETGNVAKIDGTIYTISFEQATKKPADNPEAKAKAVIQAAQHAKSKGARVAVLFDKYNVFHREDIERGIAVHEEMGFRHYLDGIVVVSEEQRKAYFHRYND